MIVLGIHYETHDSGAALIKDGKILCAVNEERLSRKKYDKAAPIRSIHACLELAGLSVADLDVVAFTGYHQPKAWFHYMTWEVHNRRLKHGWLFPFKRSPYRLLGFRRNRRSLKKLAEVKRSLKGFRGKYTRFGHEHCHVAGAYWTSGMADPVMIVAEGSGWDRTSSVAVRENGGWREIGFSNWPHSPGYYYDCVTNVLGFTSPWHAGKITGLAAYGDPETCIDHVRPLMWHDNLRIGVHPNVYRWIQHYRVHRDLPPELKPYSREDISAAFQLRLEEVLVELVVEAVKQTGKRQVALAGGTFANVKLNQRILALDGVDEIFVHPGMSDIGVAMGAALDAYAAEQANFKPFRLDHVYFGPSFSDEEVKRALDSAGLAHQYHPGKMAEVVAEKLAEGAVVGRFAGRMEYGPRALGNRSILYTPTDPTVNDWLNQRLQRTEFMPFAPSCLFEERQQLFTDIAGSEYTAEFMTITYDCTEFAKQNVPAVVHVDGTARPQFVTAKSNPGYHELLKAFYARTGLPCFVNTSFNMHEEPIVCTPDDAILAFQQSRLDYLAIENYLVPLPEALHVPKPIEVQQASS